MSLVMVGLQVHCRYGGRGSCSSIPTELVWLKSAGIYEDDQLERTGSVEVLNEIHS